jgi:hypothetical protein
LFILPINAKENVRQIFEYSTSLQEVSAYELDDLQCVGGIRYRINVDGIIDQKTYLMVERLLSKNPNNSCINVHLNSNGGNAKIGVKLGRLFQNNDVTAIIDDNSHCLSACGFAFIGAKAKIIKESGVLMLHAPFVKLKNNIICQSKIEAKWLELYFKEIYKNESTWIFNKTMEYCNVKSGWIIGANNTDILTL